MSEGENYAVFSHGNPALSTSAYPAYNFTEMHPSSQYLNLSDAVLSLSSSRQSLVIVVPLVSSGAFAVFSNIFVCYLIATVPRLKTPTNLFVFSLCICNLLFAGILLPMHCFDKNSLAYNYLVLITVLTYIGNLTSVTYERLFSITHPFRYQRDMTKRRAVQIIIGSWLIPLVYCFLPMFWSNKTHLFIHKFYITCTLVLFLILPLIFILFVYMKVCVEIKRMYDYYQKVIVATGKKKRKRRTQKSEAGEKVQCFARLRLYLSCLAKSRSRSSGIVTSTETAVRIALSPDQEIEEEFVPPIRDIVNRRPDATSALNIAASCHCKMLSCKGRDRSAVSCGRGRITPDDTSCILECRTSSVAEKDFGERTQSILALHYSNEGRKRKGAFEATTSVLHTSFTDESEVSLNLRKQQAFRHERRGCCGCLCFLSTKDSNSSFTGLKGSQDDVNRSSRSNSDDKRRSSLGKLKNRMNELKASFAFAVVAFTYMFTWLPVVALTFLQVIDRLDLAPSGLVEFSIFAIAVNSLCDPLLYGLLLKNFRVTIGHIIHKIKRTRF